MAKGKKKESLTPEERLQATLVPESEQPYKVPGNWRWTFLKPISKIRTGKKDANYGSIDGEYPFFTCAAEPIRCHGYSFDCNAILLAGNGDINNISRYNGKFEAYQRTYVVEIIEPINIDYVFYWFKYRWFDFNKDKMFGTAIPYIRLGNLQEFPIPVPPLAQQQRIVNRIESLFAKLDEVKQKAQDALDSFETRKAAILHKAFTGELTAQWRKEHGVGMESWERLKLGEIGTLERGRSQHRPRNDPRLFGGPYPFIQTGDVASANVYIMEHHQTLSEFGMEQSRMFSAGTLCITIAANIGDVAILSYDCCFPDSVVGFSPNSRSISKFIYYMMSILQKELEDNAPATAQKNINLKILNAVEMNIPPVTEQTEIVRILDDLLAKEQQAKEVAEGVLEQIDLIKKSVLARAFRGELGTNDPSEESAIKLLERSFSGTIEIEKVKTKQVAKQKAEVIFVSKTIMEALSKGVRLTPENLKSETELPIDDFYARLKELIDNGSVVESRENGESYLEAGNENRQAENQ